MKMRRRRLTKVLDEIEKDSEDFGDKVYYIGGSHYRGINKPYRELLEDLGIVKRGGKLGELEHTEYWKYGGHWRYSGNIVLYEVDLGGLQELKSYLSGIDNPFIYSDEIPRQLRLPI